MSRATPATRMLDGARVAYRLHSYDYDPAADNIGQAAAAALGIAAARMFKTLMIELDGKPACAILPSDHDASFQGLRFLQCLCAQLFVKQVRDRPESDKTVSSLARLR